MVEIAKCRCRADAKLCGTTHKRFIACATNKDCWVGPSRSTEAAAIAAWNALMSTTPAPEPAAGTVRVRIGVIVDEAGRWRAAGDYRYDDECAVSAAAENMPGENEATRIGFVTCDFPLPQPPEVPGTVESGS